MYFRLRLSFKATDNLSVGREVLGSQRHNRCEDLLVSHEKAGGRRRILD